MFHIADERNKYTPSFNIVRNSQESIAFSVLHLDRIKPNPHLLDLIFHLPQIHLIPLELQVIIKPILTFLDVLPQF